MSARVMFRKCSFCRKQFTYNPSVGDFGLICKHCGMPQQMEKERVKNRSIWTTWISKR